MALGATGADVRRLEVVRNLVIVVVSLAVGLLLSFATHRACQVAAGASDAAQHRPARRATRLLTDPGLA
jgi:hypothetical protein